jgi:hypothetical protein
MAAAQGVFVLPAMLVALGHSFLRVRGTVPRAQMRWFAFGILGFT